LALVYIKLDLNYWKELAFLVTVFVTILATVFAIKIGIYLCGNWVNFPLPEREKSDTLGHTKITFI